MLSCNVASKLGFLDQIVGLLDEGLPSGHSRILLESTNRLKISQLSGQSHSCKNNESAQLNY